MNNNVIVGRFTTINRDRGQMAYFREKFRTHVAPTKFYAN